MATALPTKERSFVFTNIFPASSLSLADYPTITILLSAHSDNQTIILSCFVSSGLTNNILGKTTI
jgi:hypothetical protein